MIITSTSPEGTPISFCTPTRAEDIFARGVPANHLFLERAPGSGAIVTIPLTRLSFDPQLEQFVNEQAKTGAESSADTIDVEEVPIGIATVRRILGLNISELADAFRVTRPTVYAWSDGNATPSRQNRQRIGKILKLARILEEHTRRPLGTWVREENNGFCLAKVLAEVDLDEAYISERILTRAKAIEIAAAARKESGRDLAAKHGFKKISDQEYDQNISAYTGGM